MPHSPVAGSLTGVGRLRQFYIQCCDFFIFSHFPKSGTRTAGRMTSPKFLLLALLYLPAAEALAENCAKLAGQLVSVESTVHIKPVDGENWLKANPSQSLCEGDTIRVGNSSRAAVQLVNDAIVRLDANTTMKLLNISGDANERSFLEVIGGKIKSFIRKPRLLTVNTPYLNGMIEGTEFQVAVTGEKASILVLEGQILALNDQGDTRIQPGEQAEAGAGQAPTKTLVVKPRDAVQWAIYAPTLKDFSKLGTNDPLFVASQALSVGQLDEAESTLTKADSDSSDAHSLKSLIALVSNDNAGALSEAQEAARLDSSSATAQIALSYAQQAQFDLAAAQASVEKAVALEPDNALAWARLAELQSASGYLDKSLASAQKAATLDPHLSRTQTVLGFAYLTRTEMSAAMAAFNKAISLDQADPLPHLGLGLAKIGDGDLHAGRGEIDIAVGLDPNQSILRSYLGKGYYEEKRSPLDEQQFELAKKLDPKDPTPWFYDAIAKQTSNRPVEALQNIEEAIVRNGNRAVYRSSLLLDSDLAARSASVGRIFSDLGYQELALREGWKGVNTDPTNFSAHRLLSDSYSVLPRHEIARVSELLQAQLLNPLNTTPIQPRLAVSNLALVSSGGAGALSFNEFNPVFNRDSFGAQGSFIAGENGTTGGEAVVYGLNGNTSFSLGTFHYETDGFRANSDQQEDIANLFLQYKASEELSLQTELRYRNSEKGDLALRFFPEDIYEGRTETNETSSARIGGRYAFSPASILLASFTYQEQDYRLNDNPFPYPGTTFDENFPDQRGLASEIQHLFRSESFNITSGIGYFDVDAHDEITVDLGPYFGPGIIMERENYITHHANAYSYVQIHPVDKLSLTLGLSYDDISGDYPGEHLEEVNPKVGVIWEPLDGTTIRAAYFEVVKRTLVTNQTLEPTQVAGFNQFFDDVDLTKVKHTGGALDQRFSANFSGGIEYSKRELDVPILTASGGVTADWKESLWRVYLLWTPTDSVALSAKYEYEKLERSEGFEFGVSESEAYKYPLGISYFHPCGFSASLVATYYDQKGVYGSEDFIFLHDDFEALHSGSDDFWTIDATLSYRLPRRLGMVTIGANNLLDEEFSYFDPDLNNSSIQPTRMVYARITLSFP